MNYTANEKYTIRKRSLQEQISKLNKIVKLHSIQQKKNNTNWGYVGDLAHIQEQLDNIFEMFSELPEYKKILS